MPEFSSESAARKVSNLIVQYLIYYLLKTDFHIRQNLSPFYQNNLQEKYDLESLVFSIF